MEMAYSFAERAKGWSSPNPHVGALIVKKDVIVGCGYHEKPGKPHAETIALQQAGSSARNSTMYITLEPCVHWGRTPPCVDSILQSGVKRVVVSALDPNPQVYKKGIRRMRQAGMDVSTGLLEEKNKRLNEVYNKYIQQSIPFVTAKVAASLNGKIATKSQAARWISSAETRKYMHLLRGEHDAIMVGINTLIQDDPQLTVRHSHWKGKRITRVILDSNLRFPLGARIVNTLAKGDILVFTNRKDTSKKAKMLAHCGIHVIHLFSPLPLIDLKKVLSVLGRREISSVLVEGGSRLMSSMIAEKLVDKMYVTLSPKLIGGENAPTFFEGESPDSIKRALRLKTMHAFSIDKDFVVEGYF